MELTKDLLKAEIDQLLSLAPSSLEVAGNEGNALRAAIAKAILYDIGTGKLSNLPTLWDRSIGKIKETPEVTLPEPVIVKTLDGDTAMELTASIKTGKIVES